MSTVQYKHPKILLMDCDTDVRKELENIGYSVSSGSFGEAYLVEKSSGLLPYIPNGNMPDYYKESEIVIIDLFTYYTKDVDFKITPEEEKIPRYWCKCDSGVVDPRPLYMKARSHDFKRIYNHGGVFILFADWKNEVAYYYGSSLGGTFYPHTGKELELNDWCFLPLLNELDVSNDHGNEIRLLRLPGTFNTLFLILEKYTVGCDFICTLVPSAELRERWIRLALQKYNQCVAASIVPLENDLTKPYIFIFPRIENKSAFLIDFIQNFLIEIRPDLFPEITNSQWLYDKRYEHPEVLDLNNQISLIKKEADKQIEERSSKIEIERTRRKYLHDLISESGDALVDAVKESFEKLGFKKVVNMDQEESDSEDNDLKEDLQIQDYSPLLLIEVKGLAGGPSDEDARQCQKYIASRMKEYKRFDIKALSIINHQRNLSPHQRNNEMPFRQVILDNANKEEFGLLTTFDLYRLMRGFINNNWKHEQVKDIFYQTGRISPIPSHYTFVGEVINYFEEVEVVGIEIKESFVKLGDRISFEIHANFLEQNVESLEIDNKPVTQADKDSKVGIKTQFSKDQLRKGVKVYKVTNR